MPWLHYIASGGAPLGLVIYEAENPSPGGGVSGDPVTEKTAFLARLSVSGAITFDSGYADFDPLDGTVETVNGVTATFATASASAYIVESTSGGLYPTSGAFFAVSGGVDGNLTITFSTAVAAFGFYMTDAGDESGQVTVTLNKTGGGSTAIDVNHTVGGTAGKLMFWGAVDDSQTYDSVVISISNTSEAIGLDDIVVATAAQLS